jgi:hypothetical protein
MAEERAAKKRGKRAGAKEQTGGKGADKKKKNPVLEEAKSQYMRQLRSEGGSKEQLKEKMKTHMKTVVKPALSEAKAGAKAKNLKGRERKTFVTEAVRTKLGLAAEK